jgi:hypothetical protein
LATLVATTLPQITFTAPKTTSLAQTNRLFEEETNCCTFYSVFFGLATQSFRKLSGRMCSAFAHWLRSLILATDIPITGILPPKSASAHTYQDTKRNGNLRPSRLGFNAPDSHRADLRGAVRPDLPFPSIRLANILNAVPANRSFHDPDSGSGFRIRES